MGPSPLSTDGPEGHTYQRSRQHGETIEGVAILLHILTKEFSQRKWMKLWFVYLRVHAYIS